MAEQYAVQVIQIVFGQPAGRNQGQHAVETIVITSSLLFVGIQYTGFALMGQQQLFNLIVGQRLGHQIIGSA